MAELKTNTESRGKGAIVRVQSASRPNLMHYVDGERGYCSCEHHQFSGAVCRHLKLVNAKPYQIVAVHDSRVPGMRYDIYGPEGYEGRCISYADAHDVVTLDLGGYVANYPGAA